ncbi:MAG: phosphatase PAP2 family protein [Acidimicrobiales bacterium]
MPSLARAGRPLAGLIVLALSSALVSDQHYLRGETAILEAVNGWPRVVGAPLQVVMQLGTLGAAMVVTVTVAVVTARPRATIALFAASLIAWRLDDVVKELIERPRPEGLVDGLVVRDEAHGFGYPSGHTALAFAVAAVLHPLLPARVRWAPWVLASLVGIARLYVGVHWPMDLVGGAALGVAIGGAFGLLVADGYRRRRP